MHNQGCAAQGLLVLVPHPVAKQDVVFNGYGYVR